MITVRLFDGQEFTDHEFNLPTSAVAFAREHPNWEIWRDGWLLSKRVNWVTTRYSNSSRMLGQ